MSDWEDYCTRNGLSLNHIPDFRMEDDSYCSQDEDEDEDEDESYTYDEWLFRGRQVKSGEKSYKSNGKSLFYHSQTKQTSKPNRIAKCHGCGKTLTSQFHKSCSGCGWMICRNCYSCGC